jgi:hypothetical protein
MVTGFRYWLGLHFVPSYGPVDAIKEIRVGDKVAWTGNQTASGNITINKPNLFGGDKKEGGINGTLTVAMGTDAQTPNAYLQSQLGANIPAYRGVFGLIWNGVIAAGNPYMKPWAFKVQRVTKGWHNDSCWYSAKATIGDDMNPIHIIYECLTNPDWGMGYPAGAIDDTNFREAADTLYTENFGISLVWGQQDQIKNFIRMVLDHVAGVLRIDRETGLYQLKLVRADYDIDTIPQVDISNSTLTSWQRAAWAETVNEITVVYNGGTKDSVITVQDMVNADIQGAIINKKQSYSGITSASLAQRVAERDLKSMSTPLAKARLQVNREAWNWLPGDVVRLVHAPMGIDAAYRVLAVNIGTLQDNMMEVDAAEDIFGLATSSWGEQQAVGWTDPVTSPVASPYRVITEIPYYTLARSLSAADLDYLADTECMSQVIAAQPSGDSSGYKLWTAAGSADLEDRGDIGDWTQYATIDGALSKQNTTTILLDSLDDYLLDGVVAGQYALIDDEIVRIDSWDTDALTITVARGCLDTVPAEHADGAKMWFVDAHSATDSIEYAPSEVIKVKCQTQTGSGYLSIGSTPQDTYTIDQRHARPYPPGKFQIGASYWPATFTGRSIAVTWAHRDRLQQTAEIIPQTDNSIGPEAGTTYNCRLYNAADVLMQEETGISGASKTFNVTEARYFRIRSLDVVGSGNFEPSEIRLYNNGSAVDGAAAVTSSNAPTAGSVSNLIDGNLATTARWTAATAEGVNFWIRWDAGVGNTMHVSEMRLGGGSASSEFLNGYTLQMSNNNSTWVDVYAVTGLSYPGNNTLSGDIDVRPATLKVQLEAVRSGLISWQTQTWQGNRA